MPVQCNKWKALGEVFETRAESAHLLVSTGPHWNLDNDSVKRLERIHGRISRCTICLANEPSVGLYHVHDHVKRTTPKLVAMKVSRAKLLQMMKSANVWELV